MPKIAKNAGNMSKNGNLFVAIFGDPTFPGLQGVSLSAVEAEIKKDICRNSKKGISPSRMPLFISPFFSE